MEVPSFRQRVRPLVWDVLLALGAAFLFRGATFLRSVIDWDESLYLLIARQWKLDGILPYTGLFDHKPPSVYFLLLPFADLGHGGVFGLRLLTSFAVAASAFLLLRLYRRLFPGRTQGRYLLALYPLLSLEWGGSASNTEHLFVASFLLGAVLALWAFEREPRLDGEQSKPARRVHKRLRLIGAGLAFGFAFSVKFVVLLEVLFVVFAYLIALDSLRKRAREAALKEEVRSLDRGITWVSRSLLLGAGFLLPLLAWVLFYAKEGYLAELYSGVISANLRHAQADTPRLWLALRNAVRILALLGPLALCLILIHLSQGTRLRVVAARLRSNYPEPTRLVVLWILVGLLEASLTGQFYPHYFIPVLGPTSLLWVALLPEPKDLPNEPRKTLLRRFGPSLACGLLAFATLRKEVFPWIRDELRGGDPIAHLAHAILARQKEPTLYVVNQHPILYALTGSPPPTRFAFPPFLMHPHFARVAGVDAGAEVERILRTRPYCIVIRDGEGAAVAQVETLISQGDYERTEPEPGTSLWCRR